MNDRTCRSERSPIGVQQVEEVTSADRLAPYWSEVLASLSAEWDLMLKVLVAVAYGSVVAIDAT